MSAAEKPDISTINVIAIAALNGTEYSNNNVGINIAATPIPKDMLKYPKKMLRGNNSHCSIIAL